MQRQGGSVAALLPIAAVAAIDPSGYAPFGAIKWLAVSTLVFAALAVALWRDTVALERRAAWLWLAFVAWSAVAALANGDRLVAFVGTAERHAGVAFWIVAALAFIAGQTVGVGAGDAVLKGAVVAGLVCGGYSVIELLWRAPVVVNTGAGRLGGPFGSAAYLGAAVTLLGPVAVGAALSTRWSTRWRAAAGAAAVTMTAALVGSGTRAAWLAVVAAAAVAIVVRRRAALRRALMLAAALAVTAGATLAWSATHDAHLLERSAGASSRVDEWRIATKVIAAHPIVGTGPEGYRVAFPKAVDAAYERAYGRTVIVDRAHDVVLDVAATTGIVGALIYGALVAVIARSVWRVLRRGEALLAGVAAGLSAYAVQQLLLFPLAELDPVAWLLAGVVVTVERRARSEHERGRGQRRRVASLDPHRTVPFVLAALALACFAAGLFDVLADRHTRRSLGYGTRGRGASAVDEGLAAVRLRPDVVRYRVVAARALAAAADLDGAQAQLDRARRLSPRDPALRIERARIVGTVEDWRAVTDADPVNADAWLRLGLAAARGGDLATAERAWTTAESLAPRSPTPVLNLARLFLDQRRVDEARRALDVAEARSPGNADVARLRGELAALVGGAGG